MAQRRYEARGASQAALSPRIYEFFDIVMTFVVTRSPSSTRFLLSRICTTCTIHTISMIYLECEIDAIRATGRCELVFGDLTFTRSVTMWSCIFVRSSDVISPWMKSSMYPRLARSSRPGSRLYHTKGLAGRRSTYELLDKVEAKTHNTQNRDA